MNIALWYFIVGVLLAIAWIVYTWPKGDEWPTGIVIFLGPITCLFVWPAVVLAIGIIEVYSWADKARRTAASTAQKARHVHRDPNVLRWEQGDRY